MNISNNHVCLDILKNLKGDRGWSSILTFEAVALSIISLLGDPNPGGFFAHHALLYMLNTTNTFIAFRRPSWYAFSSLESYL